MSRDKCKLHFGGSATPCGGKPCKTCIPFLTFKAAVILLAGVLIGISGLLLVEQNPAAELLRTANERNYARQAILKKLTEIDASISVIRTDVNDIQNQIGARR